MTRKKSKKVFTIRQLFIVMFCSIMVVSIMLGELITAILIKTTHQGDPIDSLVSATPFTIILLISLAIFFTWLSKILTQLSRALKEVSNGNFEYRINFKRSGPFKETFANFNKMAEQLSNTATLRDDFTNHFSHEFRTPITSIKGFADLMLKKDLPEEKKTQYLRLISQEAERLNTMSTNVMTLTRLNSQETLEDREIFDLSDQLRQSMILFLPQFEQNKINYDIDIPEVNYFGSKNLLAEVWTNLLNNAVKFTPENGHIYLYANQTPDRINISFKNDGPLIPQNELQNLSQKFYQLDTAHKSQGLGLGLAIVKRILDLHDAHLEITSNPPNKTIFTVILPKNNNIN